MVGSANFSAWESAWFYFSLAQLTYGSGIHARKIQSATSTKPVKVEDFYDSRGVPVVLGNAIFNRMGENVEFCDQKGMDLYQKTKQVPHLFPATGETTSATRDAYRCQPSLKLSMIAQYPDLKVADLEALTWLTTHPIKEASKAILGFMGKNSLQVFIDRLRAFDVKAADYLAEMSATMPIGPAEDAPLGPCKAYQGGRCVVREQDIGTLHLGSCRLEKL